MQNTIISHISKALKMQQSEYGAEKYGTESQRIPINASNLPSKTLKGTADKSLSCTENGVAPLQVGPTASPHHPES